MGFITTLKAGISYFNTFIHSRAEKSLEYFYINCFGKVLYAMFFEKYTEKLWGRHPSEISADWGAQRVKGLSITAILKDMAYKMLPIAKRSPKQVVQVNYGKQQLQNLLKWVGLFKKGVK